MGTPRLRLRPALWLAIIASLALAIAPTVSRALAFATGGPAWAEVCTPLGMKLQAVAEASEEAPPVQVGQIEHCGYCAFSAGAAPLPVVAGSDVPAAAGAPALPSRFLQAPRTLFAWRSAQPRAPPVHS